jgi:hypothetical protein
MRTFLFTLFVSILLLMLAVTAWASWDRALWRAGDLFAEPWFVATFLDAYCGFITFYVWVAYKERSTMPRVAWFLAIMSLGNIAMAAYMLIQLLRVRRGESWEYLLMKHSPWQPIRTNHEG